MEQRVELTSQDILSNNISTLKSLFPTIVADGKIDFEALKALLGDEVESDREAYRFEWVGKRECYRSIQTPSTATLNYSESESLNPEHENLIIEGDNLEVLKLLQSSYQNAIKMIYIDPPYNTGNDFVYPDNYTEPLQNYYELTGQSEGGEATQSKKSKEGRKHTSWLNMMFPRLMLSRTLLKDDGVIFISIDDNEVDNLKRLCNEVFGEENFVEQFIWKSGRTSSAIYTNEHEYILCYSKNIDKLNLISYSGDESLISDRCIKQISKKNPPVTIDFPKGIRFEGKDKIFPNVFGDKEKIEIINGTFECKNGQLENNVSIKCGWVMKDMIESWLNGEEVIDSKGQKVIDFYFKSNGVLQYVKERGTIHPKTIIEGLTTKQGGTQLINIFGSKVFDYPKPTKLIEFLMLLIGKEDIVLDFFAGTGTTGHATLNLNAEDGGNRKFILVQLPEPTTNPDYPTIADITKERIRRVIEGYGDNPVPLQSGFKVFKLAKSNYKLNEKIVVDEESDREAIIAKLREQFRQSTDYEERFINGYNPIDVIYENILKEGYSLNSIIEVVESITALKVYRVSDGAKRFYITFDKVGSDITLEREFVGASKDTLFIVIDHLMSDDSKANLSNSFLLKSM
jgi:adenine-specific DNA-methyltransferase